MDVYSLTNNASSSLLPGFIVVIGLALSPGVGIGFIFALAVGIGCALPFTARCRINFVRIPFRSYTSPSRRTFQ